MISNHAFRVLQLKNKRKLSGVLNKLSVKSIVLPEVYEKDVSTVNFVKRVGGQVLQSYSMRNLDIGMQDNFSYYYLLSEMYPYTQESENVAIGITDFTVDVYATKLTVPVTEEPMAGTGVTGIAVKSKIVIKYSNYLLRDSHSSKGLSSFKMIHQHVIDYTTYQKEIEKHYYASTGHKHFNFSSVYFPIIYKNHAEKMHIQLSSFDIEIT